MQNSGSSVFFTDRESLESYSISNQFAEHLEFMLVKNKMTVKPEDLLFALSLSVRDRLVRNWLRTQFTYMRQNVRKVFYLSLEFLMGRLLGNALINMNYYDQCKEILKENGYDLNEIVELENDMALGNGGLGRLAACFVDSMATMKLPAYGYGIFYEFGIFKQGIENGYQVEKPDNWMSYGNPWAIFRREIKYRIQYFGRVVTKRDIHHRSHYEWVETEDVSACAHDIPIPGFGNSTVNNLRLWQAKSTEEFSFRDFNQGNYIAAVENKNLSENISKVLYPNDTYTHGKFLRLKQQYFFVSASLQDIIRLYKVNHTTLEKFAETNTIQLNDTHPVIAIPELMRILMDNEAFGWDEAWKITTSVFSYTNHTVVPEALEEWPISILEELLPRHVQIVYEINYRFLQYARLNYTTDDAVIAQLSIIREGAVKKVKMANLAIVGSHSVNGVAELHTSILKNKIFYHFFMMFPERFKNVTNGITPRRWLRLANPFLASLITDKIGSDWVIRLEELRKLEAFLEDREFLDAWQQAKWQNKVKLAAVLETDCGISISPEALFDVQIKRFHEYKRQLLNIMYVIHRYMQIKENPEEDWVPRVVIFGGKAAPAYEAAKIIIKLISAVAAVVNADPHIGDKLKVVFMPNYSVTLAEKIIPASDLSEQISTAGFEASGTGNMKFALNGALTIGTMDGANIEIRQEVGDDNIFIFGLLSHEVEELKKNYNPREYYESNPAVKRVIDLINGNFFSFSEPGIFRSIVDSLLNVDYYCLLADFASYCEAQARVDETYRNSELWTKKSIINAARIGKFSSDRSIQEYAEKIWHISPVEIEVS